MPAPPPMDPGPSRAESSEAGLGESSKVATSKMITSDHDSFELIFMMLMGIRTAVGKFASKELPAEMGPAEFNQNWEGDFLASGTPETPAHSHSDYRFKEYSPLIFRQLRERFGISSQDYMLSLTSEYVLVEMFTNSKSGSFFFYSADYRFVLKTCTKREARAPADAPGRTGGAERNHCPDSLALGKKRGTATAATPPTPLRRRARRRLF